MSGALRSRELELLIRVLPRFNPRRGPIFLLWVEMETSSDRSPSAKALGRSVALFVVLKPAVERGAATHPRGLGSQGLGAEIDVRRVWKQLPPTELQPAPQFGSKSSSLAHFFAIANRLVPFFSSRGISQGPPLAR